MPDNKLISEPKLAKPGAGLPFFEWAIAKYILIPRLLKTTDAKQALIHFNKESNKIMTLSKKLSMPMLVERRLIPRLRGLEDSSRYYSVAMTLQHLIIVGDSIRQTILDLSNGHANLSKKGTADFKPNSNVNPEAILSSFEQMSTRFIEETSSANIEAFPEVTYPHPWFGPLNARKWLTFAAPHQRIHRQQIEEIISRL
jgi:hypothetical protein